MVQVSTFGTSVNFWYNFWYECQLLVRVASFGMSVNFWYEWQLLVRVATFGTSGNIGLRSVTTLYICDVKLEKSTSITVDREKAVLNKF